MSHITDEQVRVVMSGLYGNRHWPFDDPIFQRTRAALEAAFPAPEPMRPEDVTGKMLVDWFANAINITDKSFPLPDYALDLQSSDLRALYAAAYNAGRNA